MCVMPAKAENLHLSNASPSLKIALLRTAELVTFCKRMAISATTRHLQVGRTSRLTRRIEADCQLE